MLKDNKIKRCYSLNRMAPFLVQIVIQMFMKYMCWSLLGMIMLAGGCAKQSTAPMEEKTMTKMKALILDGENNHGVWPKTTVMIKDYVEQTGMFEVDVVRKAYIWQGPHSDEVLGADGRNALLDQYAMPGVSHKEKMEKETKMDPDFNPDFSNYDVVISNLGWKSSAWPEVTKRAFEKYMQGGGGLVVFHAADNAFGDWDEFNKMIGLGGWGGRSEKTGPYVFYDDNGKEVRDPSMEWLHTKDELYDRLRGPAENMTVLATAYSDVEGNAPPWDKNTKGTGRHEPQLMTIDYHKGRIFHTALGHNDYSLECAGFITTLQRGTEWAATGKVTQAVPSDFPGKTASVKRPWLK